MQYRHPLPHLEPDSSCSPPLVTMTLADTDGWKFAYRLNEPENNPVKLSSLSKVWKQMKGHVTFLNLRHITAEEKLRRADRSAAARAAHYKDD